MTYVRHNTMILLCLSGLLVTGRGSLAAEPPAKTPATRPSAKADEKLVGHWKTGTGTGVIIFLADGTGVNPNGTRFKWKLVDDRLIAGLVPRNAPQPPRADNIPADGGTGEE